jgi:hypothetical protein
MLSSVLPFSHQALYDSAKLFRFRQSCFDPLMLNEARCGIREHRHSMLRFLA